jgi:hypothetical protein
MQYCARETRKIVDSLWTMNLNEVSSRLQEMVVFLEGATDRGHMAAEELSPPPFLMICMQKTLCTEG